MLPGCCNGGQGRAPPGRCGSGRGIAFRGRFTLSQFWWSRVVWPGQVMLLNLLVPHRLLCRQFLTSLWGLGLYFKRWAEFGSGDDALCSQVEGDEKQVNLKALRPSLVNSNSDISYTSCRSKSPVLEFV